MDYSNDDKRTWHIVLNVKGFTLVEMAISVLLTMILLLGVGYFTHTVISRGAAAQAYSLQRNADNIMRQVCLDLHRTDPALFTVSATQMILPSKIGGPTVTYSIRDNPLQFVRNVGSENYNMLESWDRGRIAATSGSGFVRGFDVNNDGYVTSHEANMVRITLKLQQLEGPAGQQAALNNTPIEFIREILVSD